MEIEAGLDHQTQPFLQKNLLMILSDLVMMLMLQGHLQYSAATLFAENLDASHFPTHGKDICQKLTNVFGQTRLQYHVFHSILASGDALEVTLLTALTGWLSL